MTGLLAFGRITGNPPVKQAEGPPIAPASQYPGDATQGEAWNRVMNIGLTGLGVGVGARSILGLRDMIAQSFGHRRPAVHPAVVQVGVPTSDEEDPEEARRFRRKLAEDSNLPTISSIGGRLVSAPFRALGNAVFGEDGAPKPGLGALLAGRLNVDPLGKPWYIPAALGTATLATAGGYKAVDSLLGSMHKNDRARELEQAKEEYRKALIQQYSPEGVKRGSADDELGKDLSELYQLYKQAESKGLMGAAAPWLGPLAGMGLAGAGLLAGGTGYAAYNWAKARSPEERLARAIRQRERLRWATRPPEIYAVARPTPVTVKDDTSPTFEPGSDADEALVRKYASQVANLYKP
jgi:hypothetical protein